MQPKKLLLTMCFSFIVIFASSQKTKTEQGIPVTRITRDDIVKNPFSQGINEFTIQRNFQFMNTKPENSNGHTNTTSINVDYNRFIVDGLGVGVSFNENSSSDHYNITSKNSNWMLWGNVMYGTTINNNFNLYGKASAGFGKSKSEYGNISDSYNLSGYSFEVGSPIHVFQGGGNYITPFINYTWQQEKSGGSKWSDNEFGLGFRFQNFYPCSGYMCDQGRRLSRGAYTRGSSFIDFNTWGGFDFGNSKYTYGNTSSKTDISSGSLDFSYGYYFCNNFAAGADLNWNTNTSKTGSSKYTNSGFMFTPMIRINAPTTNSWNNTFLQGGYGFGTEKSTSGPSAQKYNVTSYCIDLGDNIFFSRHLAFTPKLGYEWETSKNTTTNIKDKSKGFEWNMGMSLHF